MIKRYKIFIFIFSITLLFTATNIYAESWAKYLGSKSKIVGDIEVLYWAGSEKNAEHAENVARWFTKLPYYEKSFTDGKIILSPPSVENGVYYVLSIMNKDGLLPSSTIEAFKNIEGTAKPKGRWHIPPYDQAPFVIVDNTSMARSDVALVHELLHHYYWSLPEIYVYTVVKLHDRYIENNGESFGFKDDPGHIFVYGCQYWPLGYHKVIEKHLPELSDICRQTLGLGRVSNRHTTTVGVDSWLRKFVLRNGLSFSHSKR